MWNDNNEYTVTSDDWECALDQESLDVPSDLEKRPSTRTSGRLCSCAARRPEPCACCTATGTKLAGEGPQPSPVLLRWVQPRIYSPRFVINCFKTGSDNSVGDVIEP
ncbi:hypothetical protein VD0003_g7787 [Verticillium dahliae]|nr:hypothetical protein VD0003_g7787 [Verticillium dahliae]